MDGLLCVWMNFKCGIQLSAYIPVKEFCCLLWATCRSNVIDVSCIFLYIISCCIFHVWLVNGDCYVTHIVNVLVWCMVDNVLLLFQSGRVLGPRSNWREGHSMWLAVITLGGNWGPVAMGGPQYVVGCHHIGRELGSRSSGRATVCGWLASHWEGTGVP